MNEKIWYEDVLNFIKLDNYMNFFPRDEMNVDEKINSVMRFMLYFSVILYVFNRSVRIFYILALCGLLSYVLSELKLDGFGAKSKRENYMDISSDKNHSRRNHRCTKPSKLNPFMNVLITDYKDNVERPMACDVDSAQVKRSMKKKFEHDLYRNVDDVFDRNYSYRQFYTTPSTTIPNDQEAFAKWLYLNEENTCKEGNGTQCYRQMNG